MIEFGETLRKAREAKGLTIRQIADTTHMMIQMVEDLEKENFSKIAAPIYGRGFVKLYCEAVEIDPKPMIAEFMDIYNGNRLPTIRMRSTVASKPTDSDSAQTSHETESPPEPMVLSEATPAPNFFKLEAEAVTPSNSTPESTPTPPPSHSPSRYAAPIPLDDRKFSFPQFHLSIPPVVWRLLALVGAALVIFWLLISGARALYRATMTPSESASPSPRESASTESQSQPAREPMPISPLYID